MQTAVTGVKIAVEKESFFENTVLYMLILGSNLFFSFYRVKMLIHYLNYLELFKNPFVLLNVMASLNSDTGDKKRSLKPD